MESIPPKQEEKKTIENNLNSNNNQKENMIPTNSDKDNKNEKKYENIIKKVYPNFTYVGQMEKVKMRKKKVK